MKYKSNIILTLFDTYYKYILVRGLEAEMSAELNQSTLLKHKAQYIKTNVLCKHLFQLIQ